MNVHEKTATINLNRQRPKTTIGVAGDVIDETIATCSSQQIGYNQKKRKQDFYTCTTRRVHCSYTRCSIKSLIIVAHIHARVSSLYTSTNMIEAPATSMPSGSEIISYNSVHGRQRSDSLHDYDDTLFPAPSNPGKILPVTAAAAANVQQQSSAILSPIIRREKINISKNSLSFIADNRNHHLHHQQQQQQRPQQQQIEECSKSFCSEITTLARPKHFQDCPSICSSNNNRRKKSHNFHSLKDNNNDTSSSNNNDHCNHQKRSQYKLAQLERVPKIHNANRTSLAGRLSHSITSAKTLLVLLALGCLVVSFPITSGLSSGILSSRNDGNDEGPNTNESIEGDFYSTTTALSQQQQPPHIPFSAIRSATTNKSSSSNGSNYTNEKSDQSAGKQARFVTAKRAARSGPLPISESELLPFSEFIIQPPAFNDLMKSWPPTTLRAAESSLASAADSLTNRQRQRQQYQKHTSNPIGGSLHHLKKHQQQQLQQRDHEGQQDLRSLLMRNHLNEDLDDTIVTADQSFEREQTLEPETWINYLGDLGDYIYLQLKHYLDRAATTSSSIRMAAETNKSNSNNNNNKEDPSDQASAGQQQQKRQPLKMDTIDELLDDYYYDQYENSQVLYYGAQLVHEHESFELGCFLPIDQQAEWTKSGRPLPPDGQSSPRTITRSLFLNAKQNFTLKVFTASLSDSGNYRCSKMSRKFHKLIVVPGGASLNQIYTIQQRLLSVVSPSKLSSANTKMYQFKRTLRGTMAPASTKLQSNQLYPGYLIVENEPLVVNCNISDVFVLQRLRDNPQFRLAWYKSGKQLPGSKIMPSSTQTGVVMPSASNHHSQRGVSSNSAIGQSNARQIGPIGTTSTMTHQPRIQFLDANGRRLFISSALFSDAGEYLCSWSNLPARQMSTPDIPDEESNELLATNSNNNNNQLVAPEPAATSAAASNDQLEAFSRNPLAAGSLSQLIVPVKLRPFKSTYHVRRGSQLRLVCQVQRGYPQARLNWYAGNRLVDAEFLKEHAGQYKVLYLQNQNQVGALVSGSDSSAPERPVEPPAENPADDSGGIANSKPKIVEINPIPMGKLQLQLTQDGKWVEYRDLDDEKAIIDTSDQQLRYMQQKFARLTGINISGSNLNQQQQSRAINPDMLATLGQMSISVLVVDSLDIERDTMRYACRATNRANTDEVTTVIRVQASSTVTIRPSAGRATLKPGHNLNFQCASSLGDNAQFWWFRHKVGGDKPRLIDPDEDHIEIHNNRLSLVNPPIDLVGDYYCKQVFLNELNQTQINHKEFAIVRVRTRPVLEDFGIETSHTGQSSTVQDGDRLELTCSVYDKMTPVNITWLRSVTSDDETSMMPLREGELEISTTTEPSHRRPWNQDDEEFTIYYPTHYVGKNQHGIEIQTIDQFSKKLVIESVSQEHRSYYACVADNGITERTKRIIFIRVKDRLIALWPFLGILAEFFILFTIIKIWETQRFNYTYGAGQTRTGGLSSKALLANKGSSR